MTATVNGAWSRVHVAALLLIVGLLAGPVGTHVYWALGGTWDSISRRRWASGLWPSW